MPQDSSCMYGTVLMGDGWTYRMHAEELAFSLLTGCSGSPVADRSLPPTHRVSPMPGSDSMVTVAASRHYH